MLGTIRSIRRRHAGPRRDLRSLTEQTLLQRPEELQDYARPAVVSHEADTPRLALELAKAATDLDAELAQQPFAYRQVVHASRDAHRVELRQLVPLRGG